MTVNAGHRPSKCEVCYTPITHRRNGRPRKTCSDLCRQHRHRSRAHNLDRDRIAGRQARAAETTLKGAERYRGRVDETPHRPGLLASKRTDILFELRAGLPLRLCQWCAKPMQYRGPHGRRVHCCSRKCSYKFRDFRKRLEEAFITYEREMDWMVTFRLRDFNYLSKEPQFLLRFQVNLCKYCNRPFIPYRQTRRYCSKQCRQKAWYRRHHKLVGKWRRCMGCLKKFRARLAHQTTCGPSCRLRFENVGLKNRPGVMERQCAGCGQSFLTRNSRKKFCEEACGTRHRDRMRYLPKAKTQARERCIWCGTNLPPAAPTGGWRRQTCSTRCWRALYRMRQKQGMPLPAGLTRVDELIS